MGVAVNLAPPYRALLNRFMAEVGGQAPPIPHRSGYAAIILDDRKGDPDVEAVIDEVEWMLQDWPILRPDTERMDNPTAHKDALKLSTSFWWSLRDYERVLYFEADTLMLQKGIYERFLEYDYIGAVCGGFDGQPHILNGGFSLRNPRVMLDCLIECPLSLGVTTLRDGSARLCEDVFFTRACQKLGKKLPDERTAKQFALESSCIGLPVGVHRTLEPLYHSEAMAWQLVEQVAF